MISKVDNFGFFSKACVHLLAEDIAVTFLLIIVMFAKMDTFWFVSKAHSYLVVDKLYAYRHSSQKSSSAFDGNYQC